MFFLCSAGGHAEGLTEGDERTVPTTVTPSGNSQKKKQFWCLTVSSMTKIRSTIADWSR